MCKKNKEKKDKVEKKDSRKEQLDKIQKELDDLVENMKVVTGENVPDLKITDITKKGIMQRKATYTIIEVVLSIIILIALSGYFNWFAYRALWNVFVMIAIVVGIEFVLNFLINRFFIKLFIYSFGLIKIVPSIIGFVIACLFSPGISITNIGLGIIIFILYLIVKNVLMFLIEGKRIKIIRR